LPNAGLVNSSITIGGTAIALGASSNALANDITVNGLTVGKGASSVANNTALGGSALGAITSGDYNVAIGKFAVDALTDGSVNVAVGALSLSTCVSGNLNTAVGHAALQVTTGSGNQCFGYNAGKGITTGNYNTIVGHYNGLTTESNMLVLADGQQSALLTTKYGYSLALADATMQSGSGITFPATQSASSNANTLDDYEEGTWTPTLNASSTNPTVTYTQQSGTYVKVGKMITLNVDLRWSAQSGGAGSVIVGGLPFTSSSTYATGVIGEKSGAALSALTYVITFEVASSNTICYLLENGSGTSAGYPISNLSSSGYLIFSFTYITAT
jgi:hypothetical protein